MDKDFIRIVKETNTCSVSVGVTHPKDFQAREKLHNIFKTKLDFLLIFFSM